MSFSFDKVAENLEKEGKNLLCRYKIILKDYISENNSRIKKLLFKLREDLLIADSMATYEKMKREEIMMDCMTNVWIKKCKFYYDCKKRIDFEAKKEISNEFKDFHDEIESIKKSLLETSTFGKLEPSLQDIVFIFSNLELDMEFEEDIYYDVITFLKRYRLYKKLFD